MGSSSLTRDRTQAPCVGSMESYPLDCQGSSNNPLTNFPLDVQGTVRSARWADTMYYQTPVMRRCFWGALSQGTYRMKGIYHRPADMLFRYFSFRWARRKKSENFTFKLDFQFLVKKLNRLRITSCMIIGWTWAEAVSSQQGTWALRLATSPSTPYCTARPASLLVTHPERPHTEKTGLAFESSWPGKGNPRHGAHLPRAFFWEYYRVREKQGPPGMRLKSGSFTGWLCSWALWEGSGLREV